MELRNLKSYKIFEKNLSEVREELENFQRNNNLDSELRDILNSFEGIELSLDTVLPYVEETDDIDKIIEDPNFIKEIEEDNLRFTEITNTKENSTVSRIPFKYFLIYTEDSAELDNPLYLVLQYFINDKWSDLKIFYVQGEIDNFYEKLSTVKLLIKRKSTGQKWKYISSNSGKDFVLVNKEDATTTFRKILDMDMIDILKKYKELDIKFF